MDWRATLREEMTHLVVARRLKIHYDPDKCIGAWQCYEVCPVGCWKPDRRARKAVFRAGERCVACGACVLQCPEGAIQLKVPSTPTQEEADTNR